MFDSMVATPSQIAIQVLHNLNLAVTSGLGVDESFSRLGVFYGFETDKKAAFTDSVTVAHQYRKVLRECRCIDYSLAVEIYNDLLLPDPKYQAMLQKKYHVVMVDNLEESLPVQVDLILRLLTGMDHACAAFDPSGGHTSYFGADPDYAWNRLHEKFTLQHLENCYGGSADAIRLAPAVKQNVFRNEVVKREITDGLKIDVITTDFRSESILALSERIVHFINSGSPPGEIIVVVPKIDRVLEVTLTAQLKDKGIPIESLTRKEFLSDEEFAQVMVTLAAIIQDKNNIGASQTELARTFNLILNLDPIRSQLLARFGIKHGLTHNLPSEIMSRIGFATVNRYQEFVQWVESKQDLILDENNLFQQLFAEMTAPLIHEYEDIITSRQIIKSAIRYKEAHDKLTGLADQPFLNGFLDMIHQGTVAADVIRMRDINPNAVILSTPVAFFKSNRTFAHQFWLDCSSDIWMPRGLKELSNPFLLTRSWNGIWNDEVDSANKAKDAARTVSGLLYRARDTITLLVSEYNSLGLEQEGNLHELVAESVVSA
jgi:superfamily I DNA/RNA helicase